MLFEGKYLKGERLERKIKKYKKSNNQDNYKLSIEKGYDEYGQLIEEYEILNGIKNGKAKEYYYSNGNLYFEGEYLDEKKHGKAKAYYDNGKLKFEGEFNNGIKWEGKGYKENGEIDYELINGN